MHIYKFTHTESNRCYIGQTIQDPNQRRLEHINGSKHTDCTYHFHNALRKYGIDAFTFDVIAKASTLEELNRLEEQYVDEFDSIFNGFNIRQPGNNKTHNPASIERMRESQRAAHARRREQNGGIEKHTAPRNHKGKTGLWCYSEEKRKKHSEIMKEVNKKTSGGKTWKVIDGKRVWLNLEAAV